VSIGLIFGVVVIAGLALWGFLAFRSRVSEWGTEASSFHDSGIGAQVGGHDGGGGHGGGD
jgi:hypothetical protein